MAGAAGAFLSWAFLGLKARLGQGQESGWPGVSGFWGPAAYGLRIWAGGSGFRVQGFGKFFGCPLMLSRD